VNVSECVVPAITAVSNPNRRPPSAPTAVAFRSVEFNFIIPARECLAFVKATTKTPHRVVKTVPHATFVRIKPRL
jgi:hypothetical protein